MSAAPVTVRDERTGGRGRRGGPGRRRRTIVLVVVIGAAGAVIAVVVADPFGSDPEVKGTKNRTPTSTAEIKQGTVSSRTSVNGTLAYAGNYVAINQAGGVFTKLPAAGRIFEQGQTLYHVNGKPVVYLEGGTPMYRELKKGSKGSDVRQLNKALVEMGFGGYVDSTSSWFNWATEDAVERLEDARGLKEDGKLSKEEVVFVNAERIRVTKVNGKEGTAAQTGTEVLTASSMRRHVSVQIAANFQERVKVGDPVEITLPNLKTTKGKVSSVGTVAKTGSDNSGAKITVGITPTDPKATGSLDQAPVQVSIVTDSAENVLSVPVNSLLALLDSGYGVEVVDARGARKLVPVELGMFDNSAGTVEVKGAGLAVGQRVVVPAS